MRVKSLLDSSQYRINISLIMKYKLKTYEFEIDSCYYLTNSWNQEARWVINNAVNEIKDSNIAKYGAYTIIVNSRIMSKATKEAIRELDTQIVELNYIMSKYL